MIVRMKEYGSSPDGKTPALMVTLECVETEYDLCEPFYRVAVISPDYYVSHDSVDKEDALWQYEAISERVTLDALLATGFLP